jgi:hypothetical protein
MTRLSAMKLSLSALVVLAALIPSGTAGAATGGFQRAWGKDVVGGRSTGFELCTDAATCQAGTGGTLGGELWGPVDVAADAAGNSDVGLLRKKLKKAKAKAAKRKLRRKQRALGC